MYEPSDELTEAEHALERILDRTVRAMPLRRAPATLESRVMAELQRRAALPWWQRSFSHWPDGARVAFALICVGMALICITLVGLTFLGGGGALASSRFLSWPHRAAAVLNATAELAVSLARAFPADWVYEGLAVSALLYAALFGIGIAAYRWLYLDPLIAGDRA